MIKFLRLTPLFLLFLALGAKGQRLNTPPDTADFPYWIQMMQYDTVNFFTVQKAFYAYYAEHHDEDAEKKEEKEGEEEDEGIEIFKRWEYINSRRIKPDGTRITSADIYNAFEKYKASREGGGIKSAAIIPGGSNASGNWTSLGPAALPGNRTGQPNGMGRINAIAFSPSSAAIIYIGAADGGLWASKDTGATWTAKTDALASLGVSAIAVDPGTASTIYIGTGDRDNNDATGIGIMKSTNSGSTWSSSSTGMGNVVVSKILIDPKNTAILLAATSGGVYRSTNSGGSWTRTSTNTFFKDITFKPHNPNVVYATAYGSFYRSTNNGASFTQITSGLTSAYRGVIGVSAADTNRVYFITTGTTTFSACYISTNGGTSFRTKATTPNIMDYSDNGSGSGGQAFYDLCISVDTAHPQTLYVGGINVFKSTDSGATWTVVAHWVGTGVADIHADIHVFAINPLNNRLYVGNDGGIYYTANGGSTWKDLSGGLTITEIYKIGQSATRSDMMLIGMQDNGTAQLARSKWYTVIGGDGMVCAVDPKDTNYQYGEIYYGTIYQSINAGQYFYSTIAGNGIGNITESGAWVTPYIVSNYNSNAMFAGYNNIWVCTNLKSSSPTWTQITSTASSTSAYVAAIEQSATDSNTMFYSRDYDYTFYISSNVNSSSPTWTDLTSKLPNSSSLVTTIRTHPKYGNVVYIIQDNDVYVSLNKGTSWTKITGSLPNVPKNDLVIDKNSLSGLYIATDAGVYYRDSTISDWVPFYSGLPTEPRIMNLAIYYDANQSSNNRINAGSFGRGAWQSGLFSPVNPVAAFGVNNYNQCYIGNSFSFTDSSTISADSISSRAWTFGDGKSSTLKNPTHTYAGPGTYTVKLTVTSSLNTTSSVTKTINVYADPFLGYNVNTQNQCLKGNSFTFKDISSISSPASIVGWSWNYGDGTTPGTSQSPTHSYTAAGTYKVIMTNTTNNGCNDTLSFKVTVFPQPTAAFSINSSNQCFKGNSFSFTDKTTSSSGSIKTWAWDFGDSKSAATQSPTHSYTTAGSYRVKLTVTTNNGCTDTISKAITVYPQTASIFTVNDTGQCFSLNAFTLTDKSTVSSGSISSWAWTFGDGNSSTKQSPKYSYSAAGIDTIKLTVTSNNGCTNTSSQVVYIYPQPRAGFSINKTGQCMAGNSFAFSDTSTVSSGTVTGWTWTFGDGNTSYNQDPIHTYTTAGTYNVRLIATSNNGCTSITSKNDTVNATPVTGFTTNNTIECLAGNSFNFTDTSSISAGSIASRTWNFGDSKTLATKNATHVYTSPGTYTVKLKMVSDQGCPDSALATVTVNPKISAAFSANNSGQCLTGNSFAYTDNSTLPATGSNSWAWSFGDNNVSSSQSPVHAYLKAGNYSVKLVVANSDGCKDSITKTITVYPQAQVKAAVNFNTECFAGNVFQYTDSSSIASGSIASRTWGFGDSTSSNVSGPNHSYKKAGIYLVTLKTKSDKGCIDSVDKTIIVNPTPAPQITGDSTICQGVTNIYQTGNDSGARYAWTTNNGTIVSGSGSAAISIKWLVSGAGTINVTEINSSGCADSASEVNVVYPAPVAKFGNTSNSKVCVGTALQTKDSSTADSYSWNFGDPTSNADTSSKINPAHTYSQAGKYQVKLKVKNTLGCYDSTIRNIAVNPKPNADWRMGTTQMTSITLVAADTTFASGAYTWDLGDGTNATGGKVTHTYPKNKTYTVKLTVTGTDGCVNEFDSMLNVTVSGILGNAENKAVIDINIFPNPFQNSTSIQYHLGYNAPVRIELYDVAGKQIGTLVDEKQTSGQYSYDINAAKYNLKPGMYFVKFYVYNTLITQKIMKL